MTISHHTSIHDPLLVLLLEHSGTTLSHDKHANLALLLQVFARIPYENLSKIIGVHARGLRIVKQSPEEIVQGFITNGSGGTCFPLTLSLQRFINALGFETCLILADRRYGSDTHCALLCKISPPAWHLIDPGYLITTPCRMPRNTTARYALPFSIIELRPLAGSQNVALHTAIGTQPRDLDLKYRLTYKLTPVDDQAFHAAWERSFDWEMMTYPVVSSLVGDKQVYLQKNTLLIRSTTSSRTTLLSDQALIEALSATTSLAPDLIGRALQYLR